MTFDEYERAGKQLYADFAALIAALLGKAVAERGEIRLQHVQHRPKGLKSLHDKLVKQGIAPDDPRIEVPMKDLAGCRLVFYTNTDVSRFLGSGLINELFDIDWERTKFHHPTEETSSQFRSDNIVVRLKEPHISKPEYAKFRDMRCEVQIQTALNHAWSEMAHDVYKRPALKGFGAARMHSIEERMDRIIKDYLVPAGYEFQKIRDDFDKLAAGKALFDQDVLRTLESATDNNQRLELLEQFSSYLLPDYDDVSAVQADIRKTMASVIGAARTTPRRPIDTPIGRLDGMTADHVFDKAIDVVDTLRYAGPDSIQSTFDLLCELYRDATSDNQRKRVLQSAEHLAKNEMAVWKQAGPIVQHMLAERILELDLEKAAPIRPVLMKILDELLNPEVSGSASTYKTITLSWRAADPSDALVAIRALAIQSLQKLFRASRSDDEKREVIQALSEAFDTPHRGNYPDGLLHIVLSNTLEIIQFYSSQVSSLSFELLQKLEHDCLWLFRRSREMPADADRDPAIREIKEKVTAEILRIRDQMNQNQEFVTYKTLVGFESVFPPAWEDPEFEVEREQAYRDQEIERITETVNDDNAVEWLGIIRRCLQTKSNDLATFPDFGKFLEQLATKKSSVALRYLDQIDKELESIVPPLLSGLEVSAPEVLQRKVNDWVGEKKYLAQILWYYKFSKRVDVAALKLAAAAALDSRDEHSVSNAIAAAIARYKDLGGDIIEAILLPGIDHLEKRGNHRWAGGGFGIVHGKDSPFQNLNGDQARRVLAHLVTRESIDTRLDYLIGAIGKAHPNVLIDFLGARVHHERVLKGDGEVARRYDAIPFRLHKANETLKKAPDYMLQRMQEWYREDPKLFSLRAGRLAHSVYQRITPELAASFMRIVETGDEEKITFVLQLLERFEGTPETQPLYKAMVARLPTDSQLLQSVSTGFNATGVVSGEFGMAEAYKERLAAVHLWLEDGNEKVRSFAKAQTAQLERMIAAEQRRAEEDLELRKRNWGTGPDNDRIA